MLATGVARCGLVCACMGVRVASMDARLVARPGMQCGSGWYAVVPTHPGGLKQALLAPKLQCVMVQTVGWAGGRRAGAVWWVSTIAGGRAARPAVPESARAHSSAQRARAPPVGFNRHEG